VNEGTGRHDLAIQLHQFCFYPRALMTPSDAVFVAKMIRTMHDLGTNGFTTVFAYMQVSFRCHNLGLKLTSSSSAIHLLLAYSLAQRVKLGILVCPI
jgi:hypothetical protein